jgi:NhaP-type Na+/H+ or K+/H+ antiporter
VLAGIRTIRFVDLAFDATLLIVFLIALRVAWVCAASWIAFAVRRLGGQKPPLPRANEDLLLGWTGMRGVIGLAAAMTLPDLIEGGAAFPQRDVLIFLSFVVILATLVVQGLSLPWVIRKLGLAVLANSQEAKCGLSEERTGA